MTKKANNTHSSDNQKNGLHSTLAGALGGGVEWMMTAPFNALKMQQKFIGKYTFAQ